MEYNFDTIINRRGTNSMKWDSGSGDLLAMWMADMDFAIAPPIQQALQQRLAHPILGYSLPPTEYYDSVVNWFERRLGWKTDITWYSHCPGVVPALHFFCQAFLKPEDKVLLQIPVYYPFFGAAKRNKIQVTENRLLIRGNRYEIDFVEFEALVVDPAVKMFFLCNPHNPGGRMWTKEELLRMGNICLQHNVIVVSDEIHCDLVMKRHGKKHIPMASVSQDIEANTITCVAPSKTFNLAGLQTSCLIIPNPELKEVYDTYLSSLGIMRPNAFGITALQAAYGEGEAWLEQLLNYLEGNLDFLREYVANNLPGISLMEPDATYLVWMNFRELQVDSRKFHQALLEEGKVWLDEGYMFGKSGEGFERINIACPRSLLKEGLDRIRIGLQQAGIL